MLVDKAKNAFGQKRVKRPSQHKREEEQHRCIEKHPAACRYPTTAGGMVHPKSSAEPAEAQKASFGLGVALVCRVVCPPGVYAYPGFASIICFGVVRPCGASELIVPIKVLYATLWLIRTNGVNACTYGAHPGNANWVFSAPIRYLVP